MSLNIETHWTPDVAIIKARTPDGIVRFGFELGKDELIELAFACVSAARGLHAIEHLDDDIEVTEEEEEAWQQLADLSPDGRFTNG